MRSQRGWTLSWCGLKSSLYQQRSWCEVVSFTCFPNEWSHAYILFISLLANGTCFSMVQYGPDFGDE